MARGLPVVGTRIAGIPELIDDGVNGLLVAPGRADLLADAVARLLTDPRLSAELTTSARRTIEDDFNASREAVALSNIFATMSGKAGSAE
jgi:glycosyltransferase involved in cell wall biosynthesis